MTKEHGEVKHFGFSKKDYIGVYEYLVQNKQPIPLDLVNQPVEKYGNSSLELYQWLSIYNAAVYRSKDTQISQRCAQYFLETVHNLFQRSGSADKKGISKAKTA